jgi:hypothetical protein
MSESRTARLDWRLSIQRGEKKGVWWGINIIPTKKTPHCGVFSEIGRRERIRTSDPLVPNQLRYQAALLADFLLFTLHGLSTYVHVNINKYLHVCVVRREGLEPSRP